MPEMMAVADQAEDLRQMVLRTERPAVRRRPYIVSVMSGKGGVGKSTIALNLAAVLADGGNQVLLVDGDPNVGNLDLMLGITPEHRIDDVYRGSARAADILVEARPNLFFLPGPSGDIASDRIPAEEEARVCAEIAEAGAGCRFVIIDTASGFGTGPAGFAAGSDELLVVTTAEITAIVDAYAALKIAVGRKRDTAAGVIVNNVPSFREGEDAFGKLKAAAHRFLNMKLRYYGAVPADSCVQKAIADQEPVVIRYPDCAAAHSLGRVAGEIAGNVMAVGAEGAEQHD